ncbi:hypothetical protein Tco_0539977, partial [Tanacetum coccineum]
NNDEELDITKKATVGKRAGLETYTESDFESTLKITKKKGKNNGAGKGKMISIEKGKKVVDVRVALKTDSYSGDESTPKEKKKKAKLDAAGKSKTTLIAKKKRRKMIVDQDYAKKRRKLAVVEEINEEVEQVTRNEHVYLKKRMSPGSLKRCWIHYKT